jgi:hypothetical protein
MAKYDGTTEIDEFNAYVKQLGKGFFPASCTVVLTKTQLLVVNAESEVGGHKTIDSDEVTDKQLTKNDFDRASIVINYDKIREIEIKPAYSKLFDPESNQYDIKFKGNLFSIFNFKIIAANCIIFTANSITFTINKSKLGDIKKLVKSAPLASKLKY